MQNMPSRFLEFFRLERKRASSGLSVPELERWTKLKQEIDHHRQKTQGEQAPRPDREQRSSPRIHTKLHCSYASTSDFEDAIITNLSAGGVFISTSSPLPIGETVQLHLHVGSSKDSIEVQAIVVSTNAGHKLDAAAMGMGLRFSRMSSEIVKEVHDLYERELEREAGELKGAGNRLRSAS